MDVKTDKEDSGELLILELLSCMDANRGLSDMELLRLTDLVKIYQNSAVIKELNSILAWDKKIDEVTTYESGQRLVQFNQHIIWTNWIKNRIAKLSSKQNT